MDLTGIIFKMIFPAMNLRDVQLPWLITGLSHCMPYYSSWKGFEELVSRDPGAAQVFVWVMKNIISHSQGYERRSQWDLLLWLS